MNKSRPSEADNPMEIELRGYEIARKTPMGWEQVGHFRPTVTAWMQASKEAANLQDRWPNETYRVRPIVSMKAPEAVPAPVPIVEHKTAHENPQEAPIESRVADAFDTSDVSNAG